MSPDDTTLLRPQQTQPCEWFARCTNWATRTREHPVLGDVPICQPCHEKVTRIEEDRRS